MAISKILSSGQNSLNVDVLATSTSFYNCTGSVSHDQLHFTQLKSGLWFIEGRVNIASFVRTGANPGVYISLPSDFPTPTKDNTYYSGFRAQYTAEIVMLQFNNGSRTALLSTTESFANAGNGALTFVVNGIVCPW